MNHLRLYRVESQRTLETFLASEPTGSDQCLRFLSVMITRSLLSLRKAAASKGQGWSFGELTAHSAIRFDGRRGVSTEDGISLGTYASTHGGIQTQA